MGQYQSNVLKINIFCFFYMFLVIVPVVVPYFLSLGLSMTEVFITQAVFCISIALFEVPSAYFGDLLGRKKLLIFGSTILGLGFTLLLSSKTFLALCFYEAFLAIGASFISGADLSILYDSIEDDRLAKKKALGQFHSIQLIGEALAAICCSLLMLYGYPEVLKAQFVIGWVPLLIALSIKEPPIERMDRSQHKENFKEVFDHIFKNYSFLRSVFLNIVVWSVSTFTAIWLIKKYWADSSISISNLGYFWAVCNLTAAIVGQYAHRLELKIGSKLALVLIGIIPIASYITMGLIGGVVGIIATLGFYVSRGLNMVIIKEAFNHRIPSKFRNTANSLSSLCFRLTFFILGPLIGLIVDFYGMNWGLITCAIVFSFAFILLMLPMVKNYEK